MATLTVQSSTLAGLTPSYDAAAAGLADQFANTGNEFIHVKNGGGGACQVTVDSPLACNQGSSHDVVVSVPAGSEKIIGPFPANRFNDASGMAQIAYDQVSSVTIAVIKVA